MNDPGIITSSAGEERVHGSAQRVLDYIGGLEDVQCTATVALTVLRRALVEGAPVTREAISQEAAVVFATDPAEAVSRLDTQAQDLGVSALM